MTRKIIMIVAGVLSAMCAMAQDKSPAALKAMSFNIRNGEAKDGTNSWVHRGHTSMMMIEDQKPDILGLQEAYSYQAEYLKEFTKGYKKVGVGREDGKRKGEQMCIFYNTKRISLLKWGTFWLSETPDKPSIGWDAACRRTATWALMKDKATGKKFFYVNTHLDHVGQEARLKGLALIVDRIGTINKENLPMVLTGDFNMEPGDPAFASLKGHMNDAREAAFMTDKGGTFNDWGHADEVIDYVFYSGFSSCTVFEVIRKPYDKRKFISDHYPVMATLIF